MRTTATPAGKVRRPSPSSAKPSLVSKTVASRLSLAKACDRFLLHRETEIDVSAKTLKWYRQKFGQLQRESDVVYLDELSRDKMLELVGELRRRGRSPHYVRGWYQVFRSLIGWAREEGYEVHPSLVREHGDRWFSLRKPVETEADFVILNQEDLDRIYDAAGQPRNVMLCKLLVGTGLRLEEALSLQLEDIQDDRLRVRQGKGRKPRWVPLTRQLQRELTRYVERVRPDSRSDRLFTNRSGEPWSESAATSVIYRVKQQTKLPVHAHVFRHTFATEYIRVTGDIDRLRRILGHTTFKMTAKYVKMAGVDLGRGIDQMALR